MPVEPVGEAGHLRRLALVIGFLVQLPFGFGEQRCEVQFARQDARDTQQCSDIVDIGIDAFAHARVLNLDRQFAPVGQRGAVYLSDRCGGDRSGVEAREAATPVGSPFAVEDAAQLLRRHAVRLRTQLRQDRGEFGRQEVARVHRNHLAKLHSRAAQVRQAICQPPDIAGGQDEIAHPRAFSACQPPRPFAQHPRGDTARQPAEGTQSRGTARRDRTVAPLGVVVIVHRSFFQACPLWEVPTGRQRLQYAKRAPGSLPTPFLLPCRRLSPGAGRSAACRRMHRR